jgi:hypothetical protein
MNIEHRRSERIIDFLPLDVHVVGKTDGQVIAGPFCGRIIDISCHGACLLMTQVMRDAFHVFHTTRETDEFLLRLTIDHPPDINRCTLNALPIWLDLYRQQEISAFKMGVEFAEDPEKGQMQEIRAALHVNQEQRGNWWRKHCRLLGKKK